MTRREPKQAKRTHPTNPPDASTEPKKPKARQRGARLAVSSGQAARYCLVSSDTIANWIAAGRLVAQRTAGGQYRIRLSDLRRFMKDHDMRTDLLEEEIGEAPVCWQYWSERTGCPRSEPPATCVDCPVYRGRAEVCHEVRPLLPGGTLRALSCAECSFLAGSGEPDSEGNP